MEAQTVRLRLQQAGIPVDLWDNHLLGLHPWLKHALGGVRVVVPEAYVEEARRVLADITPETVSDEELTHQALADRPESIYPIEKRSGPIEKESILLMGVMTILAGVFVYALLR